MSSMDAAIAELRASDSPNIAAIARKHNVGRSALSRRFHGKSVSKQQKSELDRVSAQQPPGI